MEGVSDGKVPGRARTATITLVMIWRSEAPRKARGVDEIGVDAEAGLSTPIGPNDVDR